MGIWDLSNGSSLSRSLIPSLDAHSLLEPCAWPVHPRYFGITFDFNSEAKTPEELDNSLLDFILLHNGQLVTRLDHQASLKWQYHHPQDAPPLIKVFATLTHVYAIGYDQDLELVLYQLDHETGDLELQYSHTLEAKILDLTRDLFVFNDDNQTLVWLDDNGNLWMIHVLTGDLQRFQVFTFF